MTASRATLTFAIALLLSACGGGGDDNGRGGFAGDTSNETVRSASANSVVVTDDSARAQATVLRTARSVIAIGNANQIVSCAGGGSALFTATAGSSGSLTNGVLDTGEAYSIQFFACRSASGSATVTGTLNLTVISASGPNHAVNATASQVVVTLPDRTLIFNGNSTLTHSEQTTGTTHVVADRWFSPLISTTSTRNLRVTRLSFSNVDLTHTETTTNGAVSSTSQGSLTIGYEGWVGNWSATITTQGVIDLDVDGAPLTGGWLIVLPSDRIVLRVAAGIASATLDVGRTVTWPIQLLVAAAD
jgi:hypothetical protein